MEPIKEGRFAKIGAIATVIGVIVAIIGLAITWHPGQDRGGVTETPIAEETSSPGDVDPTPSPSPAQTEPSPETGTRESSEPPHRDEPTFPLEFTLHDGDQRTFLGDQASVAAEFNQIGSEDFVTLKVGTTEGEPVPHAVLGAGARYTLRLAGNAYSVYVLSVDKTARTVGVRISRSSASQEKGQ